MRTHTPTWKAVLFAGAAMAVLSACAVGVGGPGYDGYDGVGYVGDYYEPWGYEYGGWGGRYRVGPPRGGYGHEGGFGHDGAHGSPGGRAGGGRPAPSIPGRPRR